MRFEMFKDRNFVSGCVFMVVIGVVLFGTMALVTPFMQNLLGYPIQTAGFLLGSRGVGTLLTMMAAPRLMKMIEYRYLILIGLLLSAGTLYEMTGFSLDTTQHTIIVTNIVQGVGLGLLFVPITSVAFLTLPGHLRNGATAITTLTRNIGSSVGISMVIANLTSKTTEMHARLDRIRDAVQRRAADAGCRREPECAHRAGPRHARRHRHPAGGDDRLHQRLQAADDPDAGGDSAGDDDRHREEDAGAEGERNRSRTRSISRGHAACVYAASP